MIALEQDLTELRAAVAEHFGNKNTPTESPQGLGKFPVILRPIDPIPADYLLGDRTMVDDQTSQRVANQVEYLRFWLIHHGDCGPTHPMAASWLANGTTDEDALKYLRWLKSGDTQGLADTNRGVSLLDRPIFLKVIAPGTIPSARVTVEFCQPRLVSVSVGFLGIIKGELASITNENVSLPRLSTREGRLVEYALTSLTNKLSFDELFLGKQPPGHHICYNNSAPN